MPSKQIKHTILLVSQEMFFLTQVIRKSLKSHQGFFLDPYDDCLLKGLSTSTPSITCLLPWLGNNFSTTDSNLKSSLYVLHPMAIGEVGQNEFYGNQGSTENNCFKDACVAQLVRVQLLVLVQVMTS